MMLTDRAIAAYLGLAIGDALGEFILAAGRVDVLAAARALDAWMRAKPVDIGNTVRRNLLQFRKTGGPEAPYSYHDAGNGAAMRILPVALVMLCRPQGRSSPCTRRWATTSPRATRCRSRKRSRAGWN